MRTRGGARSVLGLGVVLMVAAVLGSCSGGDAPPAPTRTHAQPSLSGCPTGATCTTTSVPIVADTELWSNSPDGAYGGYGLILSRTYDFATGAPFYRDHTLLRFETGAVASAIGASRELVRAVIRLHGSPNVSPPDGAIAVRRLLSPWDEATATWNHARTTPSSVPWVMGPDDANGVTWESTGSAADLHDVDSNGMWEVDVTHDVEAFLGGEANHGVIVYRALDVALPDTYFHSREDVDPDLRPSLVLMLAEAATTHGPPPIQSDFGQSVSGIWSGANAIQQGFSPTDAAWHRIGVVRGVVTYLQTPTKSNPFPGVTVSVVGHPEFGSAATRSDGS